MSKLIVLVFAVICSVIATSNAQSEANENGGSNNVFTYAAGFPQSWNFQLPAFPQMPQIQMPEMPKIAYPVIPTFKPLTAEDIANLKAAPGSHVSGVSQIMTSHTEYIDGKPVTRTHGTILRNEDGKVSETTYESP